jgi:sialic acid synthase SpsE
MKNKSVEIAGIKIGKDHPVRIAGEIGTYFGTNLSLAKEYIEVAKEAGVDFLKTEILHDLSIIWDESMTLTYNTDSGPKTENFKQLLARKCVSLTAYEKLIKYSIKNGLPVMASVYDFKGVDFLVNSGAAAAKIASQNITNRPLIEHCAKSGLPLIMDTGNALLCEVASAVKWAENSGVKGVILNHRPDGNPCPADKHNMRLLESYDKAFGWPVGLSCHYDGDEMIYLSIGRGARLIEKPLYHKRERDDNDTMIVMYYDDFKEMVRKVRNCSDASGSGVREELIEEQLKHRACLVASKDIKKGTEISLENIIFSWPMEGIDASLWHKASGLKAVKYIKSGTTVNWQDVGGEPLE